MNGKKQIAIARLMVPVFRNGEKKAGNLLTKQGWYYEINLKYRIVLVGNLVPNSQKWKRIIESSGGRVEITNGKLTQTIKEFADGGEHQGMKLCVCPKDGHFNRLTGFLESHGFLCVPTDYVFNDYLI